jgi:hypothetical protein
MSIIRYTSAKLSQLGKKGIMTADSNGYYDNVVIGALNINNSAGERYVFNDSVKSLFDSSSIFMRRVNSQVLKGELGHPKRGTLGVEQYVDRMFQIYEHMVAVHYSSISLDTEFGKKNPRFGMPDLIAIIARVGPSGPFGETWKKGMDNCEENMCFSLRGVTDDVQSGGTWHRSVKTIITWDVVTEPGLFVANKYDSPALESIDDSITLRQLHTAIEKKQILPGLAVEDSRAIMLDSYQRLLGDTSVSPAKALKQSVAHHSALSAWCAK